MANKTYETYIAIGGKVNPSLKNAANNACKQISGIRNAMTSAAGVAAGFLAVDNIKSFTVEMVHNAASLESYRNTLNVVMKDQTKAAKIMSWAVDFANVTPFDTNEVVEASVRLQAYGMDAQKTMSQIGNMASVMNKPLMQAVEAVADAQTGELERLKEFGITKAMIVKKGNELYKRAEIVNKKGQIKDQQKFNAALFAIMNERYKNGMLIQSKSEAGMESNLVGTWQTAMAQIAGVSKTGEVVQGSFFDTIITKGNELAAVLQKMAADGTFVRMSQALSGVIRVLGTLYNWQMSVFNFYKNNFIPIVSILAGVGGMMGLKNAYTAVTGAIEFFKYQQVLANMAVLNGAAKTPLMLLAQGQYMAALKLTTKAIWEQTVALMTNPWTWVAVSIAAVVAGSIYLIKNWDTIKVKCAEVWNSVVEKIKQAWTMIQPILAKIGAGMKAAFNASPVGMIFNAGKAVYGAVQKHNAKKPIAKNALGSASFRGGLSLVGEQGPEVIDAPRGARILSNSRSRNLLSGGGGGVSVHITIQGDADGSTIRQAASEAFRDFERKYLAVVARQKRLGIA